MIMHFTIQPLPLSCMLTWAEVRTIKLVILMSQMPISVKQCTSCCSMAEDMLQDILHSSITWQTPGIDDHEQ